ncbi:MAG: hypothetical protein GY727_14405 [Gammaproteobacteria bacterium]|nr:hypothetical protein [Gammaproteobacteria bacterium]MCP4089401.1 hypothetical protein [Gammaproteobacteria bacterium]MCP4277516.1 hypothetical protein [Gammaproteobacteria bacterium]MCP4831124.1 hypothetical protein [Gammaproteobacteria bacterium]MCP4928547.1 hypothetical protein [Gammaproteobacteria bacterium]
MSNGSVGPKLLAGFGQSIEERIISELGATPSDQFPELEDVKNPAGESTGYVHVFKAEKLDKAACMSINVMPGGRYFNIHIIPQAQYNIPRFNFEGMVTSHGSKISMDLYPDIDVIMDIHKFKELCSGVTSIYDKARKSEITFQPSRYTHMRAFCSPYFLNAPDVAPKNLTILEEIANQYFDVWLNIYHAAELLGAREAEERQLRREHIARTIVEMDPDRDMIVKVYGEEAVCSIEAAMMV